MEDVSSPLSLTACAACPCCAFVLWQFHHFWQKRWIKAPRDVRIMYFAKARSASEAQRVLAVWSWSTFHGRVMRSNKLLGDVSSRRACLLQSTAVKTFWGWKHLFTCLHVTDPRNLLLPAESGWKDHSQGRAANSTHKLTALMKERREKMWSLSERNSGKRD